MDKIIGIYKITSPENHIYIGQSIDIERRFKTYKKLYCKGQKKLYNCFLKYGVENHIFEIIKTCDLLSLNNLEKHYIYFFKSFNSEKGLNLKDSCFEKYKFSEEVKQRISQAFKKKGIKPPSRLGLKNSKEHILKSVSGRKGYTHSEETRMKIKLANSGVNNYNYGKPAWNKGLKLDSEKGKRNKAVVQMDLEGNIIQTFISARKAHEQTNISYQKIGQCCLKKRNKAGGFKWSFDIKKDIIDNYLKV
jgi:group I intron endonuclease